MPPLSRNLNDTIYLNKLATRIDRLSEESGINQQFFIFPNPGKGLFSIRFEDAWSSSIDIKIFSLNGAMLHQQTSESLGGYLQLSNLPAGMYILKAQSAQNTLQHKLIIN